jgi:hypothetical protein
MKSGAFRSLPFALTSLLLLLLDHSKALLPASSKLKGRTFHFSHFHDESIESLYHVNLTNETTINSQTSRKTKRDRRQVLRIVPALIASYFSQPTPRASGFNREYPVELRAPSNVDDIRNADNSRLRMISEIRQQKVKRASNPLIAQTPFLPAVVWGAAIWFLSGSRSNPIATPLANVIYDSKQESWLQDRNDGLFADLPWEYFIILAVVFAALGFGTDQLVTSIAEGEKIISLQLAGVCLIGGCSLELGRIASGGKKQTREESDRSVQLETEFDAFAAARLQPGGNCHRSEVVQAFRRYYSKYRQADSPEYPLSDLEIEQLLRTYCRSKGLDMSPAGFYSGLQINSSADVFIRKQ